MNRRASTEHLTAAVGIERVAVVLNLRLGAVVGPEDGDDVEPTTLLKQVMALEELERREGQPPLLFHGDGLGRLAAAAGLDFDEDQDIIVAGDQINLSAGGSPAAAEDAHSLFLQEPRRGAFPTIAEQTAQEGPDGRSVVTGPQGCARCRGPRS